MLERLTFYRNALIPVFVGIVATSCVQKTAPAPPPAPPAPNYGGGSADAEPMTIPSNAPKLEWSGSSTASGTSTTTTVKLKVNASTFPVGSHTGPTGGLTPVKVSSAPAFIPRTALSCIRADSDTGPVYYYAGSESEGHITVYQFVTNQAKPGSSAELRFLRMISY